MRDNLSSSRGNKLAIRQMSSGGKERKDILVNVLVKYLRGSGKKSVGGCSVITNG
jgi:hypothetical protein